MEQRRRRIGESSVITGATQTGTVSDEIHDGTPDDGSEGSKRRHERGYDPCLSRHQREFFEHVSLICKSLVSQVVFGLRYLRFTVMPVTTLFKRTSSLLLLTRQSFPQ